MFLRAIIVLPHHRNIEHLPLASCWRRGSVVRTSVFGWRTLSNLRLFYGWNV